MKLKMKVRLGTDLLMTLALLLLMGYQFWGEAAHEWIGAGIFLLFILHHLLNISWYRGLFRGKYSPARVFQTLVDVLVLLAMLALMFSSVVLSRHVFAFLPISGGMSLARRLHILGSFWGFVLMSLHLGLHWNMLLNMLKKRLPTAKRPQLRSGVCFGAGLAVALYGGYVFFRRELLTNLLLRSEFVFLDYSESRLLFYLDYLALMGLFVFIAHMLSALLRPRGRKTVKE